MSALEALREPLAEPAPREAPRPVPAPGPGPRLEPPPAARGALLVGRNFVYRIASQAGSAVINVGAMILLGRALGPEGYGEYTFWYALIPLLSNLATAGIGIIVTREVARDPEGAPRLVGDAILARVVLGLVLALGVALVTPQLFGPGETLLILLVTGAALLDFGQDVSIWVLRAHERLDLEARLLILSQLVWIGLLFAGIASGMGLPGLLLAAVVAFAVRAGVGAWIVARRFPAPRYAPDLKRLGRLLREGLPFGLALFGVVLYGRVGLLMLKGMGSALDVSYFQVAYLLSQPFTFVATALSMALFPTLARRAQDPERDLRGSLRRAFKGQFLMALPLTLALVLLADPLIELFFKGHGFDRAAAALRIMSLGITLLFLNHAARYVLAAIDRQRDYLVAVLVGLGVNAAMCAALIPRFGFAGACLAFLGAEAAIWLVCSQALARHVHPAEIARDAFRPLAAASAAGLWVFALHAAPPWLVALACALTYGLVLWWTRALTEKEIALVRGVFQSFVAPRNVAPKPKGAIR
jgi:O-antigen/teichoic acid export membrane protein